MTRFQREALPSLPPLLRKYIDKFSGPSAMADFYEYEHGTNATKQATSGHKKGHRIAKELEIEKKHNL